MSTEEERPPAAQHIGCDDERISQIVNTAFEADTERTVAGILDALDEREQALTAFKAGDYAAALPVFERYAKYDDKEVHRCLGQIYATGLGAATGTGDRETPSRPSQER